MKSILVTGAGGGVGSGVVDELLATGEYRVLCQYRNNVDRLKKVFEKHEIPFEKNCFKADLTLETDVTNLRKSIDERYGNLWGVVNLAGASSNSMSWKTSTEQFVEVMNANMLSTFLMCREFVPGMRTQGGGRIINTSSVVAFSGVPGAAHYCAAKAAIVGYTKALSLELSSKNITANVLAMGYFDSGLIDQLTPELQADVKSKTPLKRFGTSKELSGLISFLLSDNGAFTTGQVLHMNGGIYV